MHIAILGWGSLLWDERLEFDDHHAPWELDGPNLEIEFSTARVRSSNLESCFSLRGKAAGRTSELPASNSLST